MSLTELSRKIYLNNREKGFWDKPFNLGEKLMLVVSELGEAIEADRRGDYANLMEFNNNDKYKPLVDNFQENIKDTLEDEIADAIIRLLDLSGGMEINIQKHIDLKLAYNATRQSKHGKKY